MGPRHPSVSAEVQVDVMAAPAGPSKPSLWALGDAMGRRPAAGVALHVACSLLSLPMRTTVYLEPARRGREAALV